MTKRVDWMPDLQCTSRAVLAIGVFDGVHAGHRDLLADTVAEARRTGSASVALTFDRDPEQVLHPESASPALLTLDDRVDELCRTGVDIALVVPFTAELAALTAEQFLDDVVASSCHPVAVHVGRDFRFGARAEGDLDTLYVWGVENHVEVRPHDLLEVGGVPVTSTRIRALVDTGDVAAAAELLGRPTRVHGHVHAGRGEGADIGFATANVTPLDHACIPGDGVYAGRVRLTDGTTWPSAISVGIPPTFPEARDFLEAHLIGYEGDLYGDEVTLEFIERLRAQESFPTRSMLAEAIARDLETTREIVRQYEERTPDVPMRFDSPGSHGDRAATLGETFIDLLSTEEELDDGTPVIEDLAALEAAEEAVRNAPRPGSCGIQPPPDSIDDWQVVYGPVRLSSLMSDGGISAALIAGPIADAGIPLVWDPMAPELAQSVRPDLNWQRQFSLLVPPDHADEARELLTGLRDRS